MLFENILAQGYSNNTGVDSVQVLQESESYLSVNIVS